MKAIKEFPMPNERQVTWLLPVLNGMPYLPDTLESIACQHYPDAEILAWDNGSIDGTIDLLNDWIPSRIPGRVITGRPCGLGSCLAEMVCLAKTPYCARIDADDINFPERLKVQMRYLKQNPDVVVVGSQVRHLSPNGERGEQYRSLPLGHEEIVLRLLRSWSIWHPTVVFLRDAVIRAGNYFDERPVEDYSLWLRIAKLGRLANLPEVLLDYRVHSDSITSQAKHQGILKACTDECVIKYGSSLFGLPPTSIEQLRMGRRATFGEISTILRSRKIHNSKIFNLARSLAYQEFLPIFERRLRSVFGVLKR